MTGWLNPERVPFPLYLRLGHIWIPVKPMKLGQQGLSKAGSDPWSPETLGEGEPVTTQEICLIGQAER